MPAVVARAALPRMPRRLSPVVGLNRDSTDEGDALSPAPSSRQALGRHQYIVERSRWASELLVVTLQNHDGIELDHTVSIDNPGILGRMPA